MIRSLISILFGLSLLSCDKPNSADAENDQKISADSASNRKYALRKQARDPSEELRSQREAAGKIKSLTEREKALAEVVWNAIEIDPDIAHEAFQQLSSDSPEKIRLIRHYAMRFAEQDPLKAEEWAKTLETEQETAVAVGQIAIHIAEADPERAANLISDSNLTERELDMAVVQVIQRWVVKSESDAAAWVVQFSPGAAREAGIQVVAARWLPRDPKAAFEWLESIKDNELRKETLSAMRNIMLQQSEKVSQTWLSHASAELQSELSP